MAEIMYFAEIQHEFMSRVAQAVYCNMATIDRQNRPRSRMIHPPSVLRLVKVYAVAIRVGKPAWRSDCLAAAVVYSLHDEALFMTQPQLM